MSNGDKKVLVMYDVRGIQNYIFRTSKLKDAIGASALVENIFENTLTEAVKRVRKEDGSALKANLTWFDDRGPLPYNDKSDHDVVVLYIGGGNACVMMRNKDIAVAVSKDMSRQVIERTYSLQLAVAIVEMEGTYSEDYRRLNEKMAHVKANMIISKPLGALPVMAVEIKTGNPAVEEDPLTGTMISRESALKKKAADKTRQGMTEQEKRMESYITEKEVDSTIAVVHIDGNNMGLRIRGLVEGIQDYDKAVTRMREISYNINYSFKTAFDDMKRYFNENAPGLEAFDGKESEYYLVKVIVAGDDITYVCNGKIAIASVEKFIGLISERTMISAESAGLSVEETKKHYGFSACAGISFIGSHFPFNIGYDVAEACCGEAKSAAKKESHMEGGRIGNWFDFMFCRNVQTRNLEGMRKKEYVTSCREQLLLRPYFIPAGIIDKGGVFDKLQEGSHSLGRLKEALDYFGDDDKMPRSFAKDLRNTYPLGEGPLTMLVSFLKSRDKALPGGQAPYFEEEGRKVARFYDALELMDMYVSLENVAKSAEENAKKKAEKRVEEAGE